MGLFRRLAFPLAAVLALIVAGEITDLMPCRDADCGAWSLVLGDGIPGNDSGPAGGTDAACLCHTSFVPAGEVPSAPVPATAAQPLVSAVVTGVSAGPSDVPHPPPLG